MTATAWGHLPNAERIDRVLESLRAHPDRWDAALDAAWVAARDAARDAALDAAAALIAWDDCGPYMDMDPTTLRVLYRLEPDNHAALLLLPAAIAINPQPTTSTMETP
jgi:hypothetical protein